MGYFTGTADLQLKSDKVCPAGPQKTLAVKCSRMLGTNHLRDYETSGNSDF